MTERLPATRRPILAPARRMPATRLPALESCEGDCGQNYPGPALANVQVEPGVFRVLCRNCRQAQP